MSLFNINKRPEGDDDNDQINQELIHNALVDGVILNINSYLSVKDSASMKSVCKQWYKVIPKQIVLFVNNWQKKVGGNLNPRDDQHKIFKQSLNLGTAQLQSIYVKCKWKDQGWGNRKSKIFIKLLRSNDNGDDLEVAQCDVFGLAEHDWKKQEITLNITNNKGNGVISKAQNNDKINFIAMNVGLGGGHSIHMEYFVVVISFKRSSQKTTITSTD